MEKLRVGIIGLGQRGFTTTRDVFIHMDTIEITALSDLYDDRMEEVAKVLTDAGKPEPHKFSDYKDLISKHIVDCVIVMAPWNKHIEMCICCLERGVPCACEVGGVASLDECFRLVETWERTKTPFMFMENCCYGRREMMVLNMVRMGVLGEIVHCSGGYHHDLRHEVTYGKEERHYRLNEYLTRNCENYPTHEIGPIAQVLEINRGNRFVSLTSTASKAVGLHEYIAENKADDKELINAEFAQGDIVTTVIKCERGETVSITLDTTLPMYYSRGFTVRGTKGFYEEVTDCVCLDAETVHAPREERWGNADKYAEKYEHPVWKDYLKAGAYAGHGGIDYLVFNEFFECVINNKPMPIDVYDAATWMCITPLSESSINGGSIPVEIPDFKNRKSLF